MIFICAHGLQQSRDPRTRFLRWTYQRRMGITTYPTSPCAALDLIHFGQMMLRMEEANDKFRYLAFSILGVWIAAIGRRVRFEVSVG